MRMASRRLLFLTGSRTTTTATTTTSIENLWYRKSSSSSSSSSSSTTTSRRRTFSSSSSSTSSASSSSTLTDYWSMLSRLLSWRTGGTAATAANISITSSTGQPQRQVAKELDNNTMSIRARIQERVKQRDGWLVHGARPTFPTGSTHWEALREIVTFQVPSQRELDQVFPLVSPMDWSQLVAVPTGATTSTADDECPSSSSSSLADAPHNNTTTNNNDIRLTWLGHSSLLVQMGPTCNLLTDPVFSPRASPVTWAGPQRYRPPPCSLIQLLERVKIDAVLISHNHYDHLDYETVRQVAQYNPHTQFIVPLGLAKWFRDYVVVEEEGEHPDRVVELDWHESVRLQFRGGRIGQHPHQNNETTTVTVTGLPARHWSNRIGDVDQSLWCGYSVVAARHHASHDESSPSATTTTTTAPTAASSARPSTSSSFYFAGDTAWWDDVNEDIGRRYGPFDVAALPIGAYHPWDYMKANHVNVDEAVMLKDAVRAHRAVPIHWGTFPLTVEPVMEPREKLATLMAGRTDRDSFTTWRIGETRRFGPTTASATTTTTAAAAATTASATTTP